jgi:hypothetical protein
MFNSHGWILHDTVLARPAFKASYRRAPSHRKVTLARELTSLGKAQR